MAPGGGGAFSRLPDIGIRRRGRLAFNDSERAELDDAAGKAGALDDVNHPLDVLVREGSLLGEPPVRRAADDDPVTLELASQLLARDLFTRPRAAHAPACAVARRAEGALK